MVSTVTRGLVDLSVPSGLEPVNVASGPPFRSILQGGSKGPFSEGACDPYPMAQERLDRVQASLCEDLQRDQSNMRTPCHHPARAWHPPQRSCNMELTSPVAATMKQHGYAEAL